MRLPYKLISALGLIAIGTNAVCKPRQASAQFGLEISDSLGLGFVRACGTRDIALGLLLLNHQRSTKIPLMLLALLSLADATTVVSTRRKAALQYIAPHMFGGLAVIGLAILAVKTHD